MSNRAVNQRDTYTPFRAREPMTERQSTQFEADAAYQRQLRYKLSTKLLFLAVKTRIEVGERRRDATIHLAGFTEALCCLYGHMPHTYEDIAFRAIREAPERPSQSSGEYVAWFADVRDTVFDLLLDV